MKHLNTVFILSIISFLLVSCVKDYETQTNNISCTLNYDTHVHNDALQNLVDEYANNGFVGISLLIDQPSNGLWIGSSGFAKIEDNVRMNPCHIHHTASLYKTYIATIIMQLIEENKLHLEDKLSTFLPLSITDKIPNGNLITIKNLLQQRTGIPDIFEVDFILDFFNNQSKVYTIEELLEYVYNKDPLSSPDTEFHYSDANFSLLTLVIDEIEGNHIQALRNKIFSPLNLENTYFIEDTDNLPIGLADSYWDRYNDGKIENNSDVQTTLTSGLRGSDGIISTADDIKTFIQALTNGELVANTQEMFDFLEVPTSVQQNEVYSGYGMGLMKVQISEETWFGHFGNHIGSGAIVLYNANQDITMVALQNTGTFFSDEIKGKFFFQLLRDVEEIVLE